VCAALNTETRAKRTVVRAYMIKSLILSTALAALLSPLLTELEEVELDSIQEWGNKGPTKDSAIPIKGVYLFRGLVPPLLMDTSHCRLWDPANRSLVCDFGSGKALVGGPGALNDVETSPGPPVSSSAAMRLFSVMRYSVKLVFDEDFKAARAVTIPSFAPSFTLMGELQERVFVEKLERADVASKGEWPWPEGGSFDGAWVRNNYAHGVDKPPGTGYALLPVLTDKGLNERNFALAKVRPSPPRGAQSGRSAFISRRLVGESRRSSARATRHCASRRCGGVT